MFEIAAAVTIALQPTMSVDDYIRAMTNIRDTVTALAFTPQNYFAEERYSRDDLTIVYREGAQFGWPIYAIAVRFGCGGASIGRDCGKSFRTRMARLPQVAGTGWPRHRANPWIKRFSARPALSREEVSKLLESGRLEWLEANSPACPSAAPLFAEIPGLRLTPPHFRPSAQTGVPPAPFLHADQVAITFRGANGRTVYEGAIEPNSAAAWATRLAEALERCWQPAATTPPWKRPR